MLPELHPVGLLYIIFYVRVLKGTSVPDYSHHQSYCYDANADPLDGYWLCCLYFRETSFKVSLVN